jgi:hypothetical protein
VPYVKGEVVSTPTPPAKSAPVVTPPRSPGAIKTSIEPAAPQTGEVRPQHALPEKLTGPPVGALVATKNYFGSMNDFNARADAVTRAYSQAYGIPPTPGLVLDLAASQIDTAHLPKMFTVPLSQQGAKAQAAIKQASQTHIVDSTVLPAANAADVATALGDAIRKGHYSEFISENHDAVAEALSNPMYHDVVTKAAMDAGMVNTSAVLRQSLFPTDPSAFARFVVLDPLKAFAQIAGGLTLGPPVLAFKEGQGTYESVRQQSLAPLGKTNVELGKQLVRGVKQDVHDPEANAGNLFLDLLGVASIGAGSVARGAAVGRAALAEEGAGAVGRALVRRPAPGTHTITLGDASAETLLSDNALVRGIQRTVFNQRQAGMDVRHDLTLDDVPAGAQTSVFGDRLQHVADTLSHPLRGEFSYENKLGRTIRAEARVEQAIRMSLADPINHAANVSVRWGKLGPTVERGLSVGEQKALQVLLTDVAGGPETQLAVNRAFHERLISLGYGDAEAHRAQLAMLDLAEKVLSKEPRPKFAKAVEDVKRVIDEMQQAKMDNLGLDPTSAESRVARVGAILRGEPTLEPSYLTDPIAQARIADLETQLADNVKQQTAYKTAPRSAERAAGGPTEGIAPNVSLKALRLEESDLRNRIDALKMDQKPIALARVNPESRYLDYTSASKGKGATGTFFGPTIGPYGVPVPGSMPELNHAFTGYHLQAGDFRVDATGLAGESYGRTVRAITKWNAWRKLHQSSVERPPTGADSKFFKPIRDVKQIPEKLRALVNKAPQGELTTEEALQLSEGDFANLEKFLMPEVSDLTPEELAGVRWFDTRVLADTTRAVPGSVGKKVKSGFTVVNEPVRDLMVYGKPSYILNMLNSASMAVIDQGLYAIPNVFKAITAQTRYGADVTRMLDAMAGESRTQSYAFDTGKGTKLSRGLASGWNRITDLMFRRSAAIHWLHRAGVTDEEIPALLRGSLRDPEKMKVVSEASRRAKKSMVELDNLTPFERDQLRHFIFVYPWQSRSAVWSLRTILEHPVQSAVYAEVGNETEREFPEILKRLPEYMKRLGYFPIGWTKDGKPKLVNPGSVNTFSTLSEIAGLGSGSESIESLFGPGAELAIHLITNRDQYGRTYKTPVVGPLTDLVAGLPQYASFKRSQQAPLENGAPLDMTNDRALIEQQNARLHGATKEPIFVPEGFWRSFWPLAIGGLHAKVLNTEAVNARFWRDAPIAQRQEHEKKLIEQMVTLQGELLKRPVPHEVLDAVDLANDLSLEFKKFADDNGRNPTVRERAQMSIDFLKERKKLDDVTAASLHKKLDGLPSDQVGSFTSGLYRNYADGKTYSQWHDDVRTVASFTPDGLAYQVKALKALGVDDSKNLSGTEFKHLHELGRKYLDYQKTVASMQAEVTKAHGLDKTQKQAALSLFIEQADTPVKIDGHQFPSLPRLDVARMTDGQREQMVRSIATRSWGGLNSLEKALLGRPSNSLITQAWDGLRVWMAEAQANLQPGEHLPPKTEAYYASVIAKKVPGFRQDYEYSKRPLAQRLQLLPNVAPPDNKELWNQLLTAASQRYSQMKQAGWDAAGIASYWQHTDAPQVEEWLKTHPTFQKEVHAMGTNFVYGLAS